MNQKRTTKQALVTSVLTLMLCLCMLIGSTFAWFTDSVSSDKNVIVAGNLDIELEYYKDGAWTTVEGASDIFNPAAKWEPGHAEVAYLKASNLGNLALRYILSVNLRGETVARNVEGNIFKLSDYLMMNIIEDVDGSAAAYADRDAAIEAAKADGRYLTLNESCVGNIHDDSIVRGELAKADDTATTDEKYVAVVIWMPTEVGNEANFMTGTTAPTVELGVSVVATQATSEYDGFDNQYDFEASFPSLGAGVDYLTGYERYVTVDVRGAQNEKIASFLVPQAAIADPTKEVTATVEIVDREGNFTLDDTQSIKSFNITMTNIVENNDAPIIAKLRIEPVGTYVAKEDITVYHNNSAISSVDIMGYNYNIGYVTFLTTSFSPFDVVYKVSEMPENAVTDTTPNPALDLAVSASDVGADLDWGSFDGFAPNPELDADPRLEAAYVFKAVDDAETVEDSPFKDWFCDFYVSLDTDLKSGEIFLGGNYGEWGWIGFHNDGIELEADTLVPLLGSVGLQWTYSEIVNLVGEFKCGVADVDDALAGATFTVQLRLINPNDSSDFRVVEVVNHTFVNSVNP